MHIIEAPNDYGHAPRPWVFLAGSIEMGTAVDWQARVATALRNRTGTILNPRRADWDATWGQSIDNPPFREQVEWELDALTHADLILMHFEPDAKAPITLLELGLFGQKQRVIVHCPKGFWRKGNVDIVCRRYGIVQVETIDDLINSVAANPMTGAALSYLDR